MAPRILAVFAVMALLVSTGTPAAAQVRKARKTLNLVKQVDGPGSGLDADTIQGLTPLQIQANLVAAIIAASHIVTRRRVSCPGSAGVPRLAATRQWR